MEGVFNPGPNKEAIEVCFSNKRDKKNYTPLIFNHAKVQLADSQKHLSLNLDSKRDFDEHIESKISKCNKIIGLMKKLSLTLSLSLSVSLVKASL